MKRYGLVILLLTTGCSPSKETPRGGGISQKRPPVTVATVAVTRRDLSEQAELTGTLEAEQQVAIAARATGRLVSVGPRLGERVVKGQVVAEVDPSELKARLAAADAALASARASLKQRQIDHANLRTQAQRDQDLFKQEFIARQEMENSQARAASAEALVQLALAEVSRQQASVREAQAQLAEAFVKAPLSGVVSQRHLEPGALASTGSPILSLVKAGDLKVVVQVSESVLPRLQLGQQATLSVEAWPGTLFAAKISRLSPVIQPDTRTGAVELAVIDPAQKLRPGMFARVSMTISTLKQVPAIPRQALVRQQNREGVFIAKDGKARFVPVTVGSSSGEQIQLIEGPAIGTQVITLGNHLLRDGSDVQLDGQPPSRDRRHGSH